ncbi:MAG: hemolysin III family protein, partial [Oscillospiraceae bacterium]|nr:hemolysin III family protein [Oscillospiraceae bacterium]
MASEKAKRPQSRGEEIANTVSHGVGALLALAGAAPLAVRGILSGSFKTGFSLTVYGISLVLLYTASAVYHAAIDPKVKRALRVMDHCSIFVLILGTYVPMSLLVVGGRTGWMLFLTNTTLAA